MNFETPSQESAEDKAWEQYVAELKGYLREQATPTDYQVLREEDGDIFEADSLAGQALADVEHGDFETASTFLDSEMSRIESSIDVISRTQALETNDVMQKSIPKLQALLEKVQKLKDGLERKA